MSCYRFWPTRLKSWEDARATCQARGGDLLKLDSDEEKRWIIQEIKKYPISYEWWIGLRRHPTTEDLWVWTDGSERSETDNFLQWGSGEPNNYQDSEDCAEIWDNLLNDKNCNHLLQFVCERPKDLPMACDIELGWDNVMPDRCYKLHSAAVTYDDALDLCKREEAEILSIQDENTQQNISDFLDSAEKMSVWLPYTADSSTSKWKNGPDNVINSWWSTGSQEFSQIEVNDTFCAVLDTNITDTDHNWKPTSCKSVHSVVCSKPKGTCPSGFVQHNGMCYLLNTGEFMTWTEANGFCNLRKTTLLEIQHEEDWNFMSSLLQFHYHLTEIKNVWLGLEYGKVPHEWTHLFDTEIISDFEVKMLASPSSSSTSCVYIDISTKKWTVGDCGEVGGAVCFVPVDQPVVEPPIGRAEYVCEGGTVHGNSCYKLMSTVKTDWFTARSLCKEQGSDLVTIVSNSEQSWLESLWTADFANEMWIGLNDQSKEGTFRWLDTSAEAIYYTNWMDGQPNNAEIGRRYSENCVAMYFNLHEPRHGKWVDYPCGIPRHFVCEKPADLNIAPGKIFLVNHGTKRADRLVDLCSDPTPRCCHQSSPDLLIDLGAVYNIKTINIFSMSSFPEKQTDAIKIYINKTDTYDSTQTLGYTLITLADKTQKIHLNELSVGRYIHVVYSTPTIMCEVEVFADESVPRSIAKTSLTKEEIPCVSISTKWKGSVSYTISGRKCQAWANSYIVLDKFMEETQVEAQNYCRDPIGLGRLWCYTVDPDVRWEFCGVKTCPVCEDCLKNASLTWSDAKQICANNGYVLPMQISEEDSVQGDLIYWLSVYYDGNRKTWISSTSGLPVATFLQDVLGMVQSSDTMCAVGNSKGQILAKSCFERYPYFCAEANQPFLVKTSSNETFKEVPANYIDKTNTELQSIRFEFKGYDGATVKLLDYTIRIGGNLLAKSYITRGDDPTKIDSKTIEHLCSDSEYKAFWMSWTIGATCKINVGRGLVVGENGFLQYNNCPDTNVQKMTLVLGTVMKTERTYDGFWKLIDPDASVTTSHQTPSAEKPNVDLNIALYKPARQVSQYSDFSGADKAVDGCLTATYSSRCITHTLQEDYPWFEIDLEKVYPIKLIIVQRRWENCCKDRLGFFKVYVSMFRDTSLDEDIVYKSQDAEPPQFNYIRANGKLGRYIRIVVPKVQTFIELTEVEVYEDTDASRCGKNWIDRKEDDRGTCYKFSDIGMNWAMAKEYCNGLDARMVIPRSAEEQLFIYGNGPFLADVWIGINDIVDEGTFETSDKSRLSYTDWAEGEPNDHTGNEDCAELRLNSDRAGRWNDDVCSKHFIAVCIRQELTSTSTTSTSTTTTTTTTTTTPVPTTASTKSPVTSEPVVFEQRDCKAGWTYSEESHTCMKIVQVSDIAMLQAAARCLNDNSQLASFANRAEQNFVKLWTSSLGITASKTFYGLWLGGVDSHTEGNWQWFMRNTTWHKSLQWASGQPDNTNNEDCLMMLVEEGRYGQFNDLPCEFAEITSGYICQYDLESVKSDTGWVYNPNMDTSYKLDKTSVIWKDAVKQCGNDGGTLVSVRNRLEQLFLQALGISKSMINVWTWIGASKKNFEWSWLDRSVVWSNDNMIYEDDYFKYQYYTDDSDETICGIIEFGTSADRYIRSVSCSEEIAFICARKDNLPESQTSTPTSISTAVTTKLPSEVDKWLCGAGWDVDTTSGICYKFVVRVDQMVVWSQANRVCSDDGGSLVSIVSNNEQSYLIGRLQGLLAHMSSSTGIWIGSTDSSVEQQWHWDNGDPFAYLNWAPGQPDNANDEDHCAEILTDQTDTFGLWSDAPCNLLKGYICKKKSYTEGTTTATPKPFIEYTDHIEFYQASEGASANFQTHDLFELGVRLQNTFVFEVKTERDAFVLLQNKRDTFDWLAYLVIIGGWGNTRNIIEEINAGSGDMVNNYNDHLLTSRSFKPFWITWNDTTISVGNSKNVGSSVFLTYTTKEYDINYVSVGTAQYTDAYWKIPKADKYYGCDGKGWMKYGALCFLVVEKQETWDDANTYCNQEGGDLASIANQNEQNFIFSQLPVDRYCFNIHPNDTECTMWAERGECKVNPVWMSTHCHHACGLCRTNCRDTWESPEKCMEWAESGECRINPSWMLDHCAMSCGVCTGAPTRGYWIGLHSFGYEQSYAWVDTSQVKYTDWASHHPQAFREKSGSCVGMFVENGNWNDGLCTDLLSGFICKKPLSIVPLVTTLSPHEVGCSMENSYGYGAYCYIYQTDKKSWNGAQVKCQELGGALAYIGNRYTQAFLSSEMSLFSADFWIGLKMQNSNYSWAGQRDPSFKDAYFSEGYKDENVDGCFAMSWKRPVGLWNLYSCITNLPFICQVPRDGFTTSTTTTLLPSPLPPCTEGWSEHSNFCYKLIQYSKVDWNAAKSICSEYGASMVSIHNDDENTFVSTLCNDAEDGKCWLGLNDIDYEGDFQWEDDTFPQYNKWAGAEPNNVLNEDCAELVSYSSIWNDIPCHLHRQAICKIPRGKAVELFTVSTASTPALTTIQADDCPVGWWSYSDYCYLSVDDLRSWVEAKEVCSSTNAGATLLSIHDEDENRFFMRLCGYTEEGKCWVGLHDVNYEGDFEWDDGTDHLYSKWGIGEPNNVQNEDCVEIVSHLNVWNDIPCHLDRAFICKIPKGMEVTSTTAVPVTTDSASPTRAELVTTQQQDNDLKCPKSTMSLYSGYCYELFPSKDSFAAAMSHCKEKIVSIHSDEENKHIHALVIANLPKIYPDMLVWLGLYVSGGNAKIWMDDSPLDYTNFIPDVERYGDGCVAISVTKGKWKYVPCYSYLPFICKWPADAKETTETSVPLANTTYPTIIDNNGTSVAVDVSTDSPQIRIPPFHEPYDVEALKEDQSGLSGGQIAGLVVGVIGILVIVCAIVHVIRQRRLKQSLFPIVEEQSLGFDNALFRKDQDTVSIR